MSAVLGWTLNYRGIPREFLDDGMIRVGWIAIWVGALALPLSYYMGVIVNTSLAGFIQTLAVVLFVAILLLIVNYASTQWRYRLLVVTLFGVGVFVGFLDPQPGVGTEYVGVAAVLMVVIQGFKAGFTVLLAYAGLSLAMIRWHGFNYGIDVLEILIHGLVLLGLCLGAAMTGSYLGYQLKRSAERRAQLNQLVEEQNRLALALTSRVEAEVTAIAGFIDGAATNGDDRVRMQELSAELQQSIATLVGLTHVGKGAAAAETAPSESSLGAGPAGAVAASEDPATTLSGRRVLLVDDDAMVRRATEVFLKGQLGVQVQSCSNAQQALLDLGKGKHFDLIVTDSVMPKISGAEFIQQVRDVDSNIPIIAATGSSTDQTISELKSAGADSVLAKPITRQALLDALQATRKRRDFGW